LVGCGTAAVLRDIRTVTCWYVGPAPAMDRTDATPRTPAAVVCLIPSKTRRASSSLPLSSRPSACLLARQRLNATYENRQRRRYKGVSISSSRMLVALICRRRALYRSSTHQLSHVLITAWCTATASSVHLHAVLKMICNGFSQN